MPVDRSVTTLLAVCTAILVFAAMYVASGILAPLACAFFVIAIVWPLQQRLQKIMPKLAALLVVIAVTFVSLGVLGSMVVWGVSRVAGWLVGNAARFQSLFDFKADWLEQHDIFIGQLAMEHFSVGWMLRLFQGLTLQLQGYLSFGFVVFIFLMLGLLEVDLSHGKLAALPHQTGQTIIRAATETAAKLRRYMLVRTLMSILTGLVVFGFAVAAGLDLAMEWGVIAFALNYIPFIGPLAATVLPTLLAIAQFESMQMAIFVFVCLNIIQFMIGSYLEPLIAGATLSLSPFMVLFAVLFGSFLWGISGAFIGVPVLIAVVTLCAQSPSSRWAADLLSGQSSTRRETAP
jgi:predicted PurR-regulated permease PerM